ncbi:CPXCG motif-containing cysteine-rich protein [uncultured Methylophaga sp.]|uniref:CPXCG motif-containing cysteine-rich protein n=1 Tax=uncultured Methylophaga sp. TaxID=285271 RepID=UPI0026168F23|nr:CPXCG motif-containing cysteine-rich protein [uncultured Methylophaga sp.]
MLHPLEDDTIMCPYCGEYFSVVIDCSVADQQYIEDCEVCCRPIEFHVVVNGNDDYALTVQTENE